MLGTNDLKRRFNVPATDIAAGCGILLDMIAASRVGPDGTNPKCLLVTPPPILDKTSWDGLFGGRAESSRELALNYAVVAEERRVAMFNAGDVLQSSDVDGVHWDADAHYRMGLAVAERIIQYIYPGVDYAGQPHK